jgi:uncharacterized protein (TIGR00251 family)
VALPYLKAVEGGVELSVVVQPRASRTRIVGEHGGLLKVQLAAPPVDGEANACLVEFVAKFFKLPRRQVRLVSGDTSRRKRLVVEGIGYPEAEAVMTAGE